MSPEEQLPLFEGIRPWIQGLAESLSPERAAERQSLLAGIASSDLGNKELRVAFLLQRYPETRENDTSLAIRYWSTFQPDVLEEWDRYELDVLYDLDHFETLSRIRRHIQNDLHLFVASPLTRQGRAELQMEFFQYIAAQKATDSNIRFFIDETSAGGEGKFIGIGGICAMNWKQYEKHSAALAKWREDRDWPETIRFTDTGSAAQPKAMALLAELRRRRSGLLFVAYGMPARAAVLHQVLVNLMIQVVVDALRHMQMLGCLREPRGLTLIKEADESFDAIHLPAIERYLGEQVAREFGGQIILQQVIALPKGREVFLECADLIAGGMRRRLLSGGRNPKDVLAEAVFNTTGFEDPRDNGIVFKAHPV